jgi:hypothetical protein
VPRRLEWLGKGYSEQCYYVVNEANVFSDDVGYATHQRTQPNCSSGIIWVFPTGVTVNNVEIRVLGMADQARHRVVYCYGVTLNNSTLYAATTSSINQ